MASRPRFSCSFCGKQYLWKDELAGKPISCSCGQMFRAPDSPQARWQDDVLAEVARRSVPPAKAEAIRADALPTRAPPKQTSNTVPSTPAVIPHIKPAQYQEPPRRLEVQRILFIAFCVAVLIAAAITFPILARRGQKPAPPALGDDARVEEWISEYGQTEARDWFAPDSRHDIVGAVWSREKASAHINQWYDLGAKNVLAFGGMVVRMFVIELPDSPGKRKAFFDFAKQWQESHHPDQPPPTDVGQKFLVIELG
jgi:hypothetical protein